MALSVVNLRRGEAEAHFGSKPHQIGQNVAVELSNGIPILPLPQYPWHGKTCYFFSSATKSWNPSGIPFPPRWQIFLANHILENRVFWLGLTDSDREGHWQWGDGSSPSITFWNTGEPNNVGEHGEDCATILPNGRWNDVSCSGKEAWICERSC
uniref:C-type lectin domain-containing protein n=1 Tax=Amazona collaria TaxID=241587 RepID=A0A8B9FR06_9PSIT